MRTRARIAWLALVLAPVFVAAAGAGPEDPWQTRLPAFSVEAPARGAAPILLYFTAPWCGFCKQLERTTLADEEVRAAVSGLRAHRLDYDAQRGLVERFGVRGIPAFVLTNDRGEVIERLAGVATKEAFLAWLKSGEVEASRRVLGAEERAAVLARVAAAMLETDEAVRGRALVTCWELAGRGDDFERRRATENLEALLGDDSGVAKADKAAWWRVGLAHEDLAVRVTAANLLRAMRPEAAASYDPWAEEPRRVEAMKGLVNSL